MIDNLISVFNDRSGSKAAIFSVLYVLTIIPCWLALFLIVRSFRKKRPAQCIIWGIILFVLLALPYVYLVLVNKNMPWQLMVVILLLPSYSLFSILTKKKNYSFLWTLYARVYDILLRFRPYQKLVDDVSDEVTKVANSGSVLDLGCGTGNIILALAKKGDYRITGIDSSEHMLKRSSIKTNGIKNLTLMKINIDDELSQLTGKYDIIVINNVLYTLKNPEKTLSLLVEKIKPRGFFVISEPLVGSSLWKLFKRHTEDRGLLVAFKEYILFSLPLLLVVILNVVISFQSKSGKMNFFSENEITLYLKKVGFKIIEQRKVYSEQNIFVMAQVL